jgi:hypothetical protein
VKTFELPFEAIPALQTHCYGHTFGLLLFPSGQTTEGEPVNGGTGVGVEIAGRYFVATAGHNLAGTPDSGIVLVHNDRVSAKPTPFIRRWPLEHDSDPSPDVGYVELASEIANQSQKRFVPLEQVRRGFNNVGVNVVVVGHPVANIPRDLLERQLINLRAFSLATACVQLPLGKDPACSFALAYDEVAQAIPPSAVSHCVPDPKGMSGGGAWMFPEPMSSGVWSPSGAHLVGIETSWDPKHRVLLCVQMQHWLSAVARDYSDCAEAIGEGPDILI